MCLYPVEMFVSVGYGSLRGMRLCSGFVFCDVKGKKNSMQNISGLTNCSSIALTHHPHAHHTYTLTGITTNRESTERRSEFLFPLVVSLFGWCWQAHGRFHTNIVFKSTPCICPLFLFCLPIHAKPNRPCVVEKRKKKNDNVRCNVSQGPSWVHSASIFFIAMPA